MTSTLQLTPDAAARMYQRPRYGRKHLRLTPDTARHALSGLAMQFEHSKNPWIASFGLRVRHWLKMQP